MPTSAGSENSDDKTTSIDDSATAESTKGILKFLSLSQSEWRELNPMIADDVEDVENKKRQARSAGGDGVQNGMLLPI